MKKLLLSISLLLTSLSLVAGDVTAASYRYGYGMQILPHGRTWNWIPKTSPAVYYLYKLEKLPGSTNTIVIPVNPLVGNFEIGKLYIFRLVFNSYYESNNLYINPQSSIGIEYNDGIWKSILLPCPPMAWSDYDTGYHTAVFGTDYKIQILSSGPVALMIKNYWDEPLGIKSTQTVIQGLGPVSQYLP